ncbi:hypothetical protein J6590_045685 [Homalodisca vitripennis]|nr:hypothetical protein J6590_045685 [Homalodisca vitripennis]
MRRVIVSDCSDIDLSGTSILVYRISENRNSSEDLMYAVFQVDGENTSIISYVYFLHDLVTKPQLGRTTAWGDMNRTIKGPENKKNFLDDFSGYVNFLKMTKTDLDGAVKFETDKKLYDILKEPDKLMKQVTNINVISWAETIVRSWMKKMEWVLTQSEQLRSERPDVAPEAELEHWCRLLAMFASIVEHGRTPECVTYITFLIQARSKVIKKWKFFDNWVTFSENEASDNVKYLYALQRYLEPLYRMSPETMTSYLPSLLYAIRMTYAMSRFLNTAERITTLLVKVCTRLYKRYHDVYCDAKQRIEDAEDETNLEASEMFVFGKFKTFKTRLAKLRFVLKTTLKYSILENSKLEGIEVHAAKFKSIFATISSKPYNALNHRKPDFDNDFEIFTNAILKAETELRAFKEESLRAAPDVLNRLMLINRFKKLNLPSLHLEKSYLETMQLYYKELNDLYELYFENQNFPPIPRNYPPVTGIIAWFRQLLARLDEVMTHFEEEGNALETELGGKLYHTYGELHTELLYQEEIHHRGWYEHVAKIQSCLSVPLLKIGDNANSYKVNFHNSVTEVILESENCLRMGRKVPDLALLVILCKPKIYYAYEGVKALVARNLEIRKSIPQIFVNLIQSQTMKLDAAFLPCLSNISWTSLTIPQILDGIKNILDKVDMFCKEANDMKEARVDETLEVIGDQMLIYIPPQAMDGQEWYKKNLDYCHNISNELQTKSQTAEEAVIELINKFVEAIEDPNIDAEEKFDWLDPEKLVKPVFVIKPRGQADDDDPYKKEKDEYTIDDLKADCMEVYGFFNRKNMDALTKATRNTLRTLRERASSSSLVIRHEHNKSDPHYAYPLLTGDMVLYIPNVTIVPTLEEMQAYFSKVTKSVLNTIRSIPQWGSVQGDKKSGVGLLRHPRPVSKPNAKSIVFDIMSTDMSGGMGTERSRDYLKQVMENKEVVRLTVALQGNLLLVKPDVNKLLQSYQTFSHLWSDERNEILNAFVDSQPMTIYIEDKFAELEKLLQTIEEIPALNILGPLEIQTGKFFLLDFHFFIAKFKLALKVEWKEWKLTLGNILLNAYRKKLADLWEFIEVKGDVLLKPVKDLDDVRLAMACLESVRDNFIHLDRELIAIEEAYAIFAKFNIKVPPEDIEKVDGLRFNFNNLITYSKEMQETLCKCQEPMKKELMEGVAEFAQEVFDFDRDFEENGPMVEGLEAREASDRVLLFQARFDELWRKYEVYSSGEKLFALQVNEYPVLIERKKQFNLLQKLYGLYLVVNKAIDGYFELAWQDVDIEEIMAELTDFQNRCRKLPRGMKDWPAFIELKKKIDDFNEACPLLEMMANKSMKDRHWQRLEKLLNCPFDVDNDEFTLKNVMDAPLLKFKDDVEDICLSALKERDIEAKLKQVILDWGGVQLQFANFKTRGELLLKGQETQEINGLIEESLMVMNSLAANRYNAPFKKEIQLWVWRLGTTGEILESWLIVQNLWVYLEAVFVGGDIAKELPGEAKRFAGIDKSWVRIMMRARVVLNVIEVCVGDEMMGQLLPHLQEQLETCQKSLTGYVLAEHHKSYGLGKILTAM